MVEPSGEDDVRLRGEIPFTNIETIRSGSSSGRPVMSSAAATTRSISRLHTKPRNNYRPPPPPPTLSTSAYARNNNNLNEYTTSKHISEIRSDIADNQGRQHQPQYIASAPYNAASTSSSVYSPTKQQHWQQASQSQEALDRQYYSNHQPHPASQPVYPPQQLRQNFDENNFQQYARTPNMANKQFNPRKHATLISSASSSPNMMKDVTGMNMAPSPIVSSSTIPHSNPMALMNSNSVNGTYLNTSMQQSNAHFRPSTYRMQTTQNHANSYNSNSSNQVSRVYAVNQPRATPNHGTYPFTNTASPVNSSTPITRQKIPQSYSPQISSNGYDVRSKNNSQYPNQSHMQGKSGIMQGGTFINSAVVGLSGQFSRTSGSYQSPYSATMSSNLNQQQQHYLANRGSKDRLNVNMAEHLPQMLPMSNMAMINGKIPQSIASPGTQSQNTNMMEYNDINGGVAQTNTHHQRQVTAKRSYALPVIITKAFKIILRGDFLKLGNWER